MAMKTEATARMFVWRRSRCPFELETPEADLRRLARDRVGNSDRGSVKGVLRIRGDSLTENPLVAAFGPLDEYGVL